MSSFKVTFYPDVDKSNMDSGIISEISWQRLKPFLDQAFGVDSREKLIGITVTESGIKAKFETNNEAKKLRATSLNP